MDKVSIKMYLKLYKEHCKLLCDYIKLKAKYQKLIDNFDNEWIEVIK